jgi:hypothetical protein
MNILKRFWRWLFPVKRVAVPYSESVEQFQDLQQVAKIKPVDKVVKDAIIEERQKKNYLRQHPKPE